VKARSAGMPLLVTIAVLGACARPQLDGAPSRPAGAPSLQATPAGEISGGRAFRHVRILAGRIGTRPARSPAYRRALRYVRRRLDALGYQATVMAFPMPGGGRSWNVIAEWPGAEASVLLGGHLDTVPGSPGGNDNASGVAVILELARVLAETEEALGVSLVAFGAEEQQPEGGHHIGSEALAESLDRAERDRLDTMISVDMIGKLHHYVVGRVDGTSRAAARSLAEAIRDQGYGARVAALGDISDHVPFARAGVPAALMWTGDEPNHHQPTDVVGNVARRALVRAGRVLVRLVTEAL
jgi:Peptidase family M28